MPGGARNGFDPEEFVSLMASFDTGNPSEAEAMNAGRLMRRLLVNNGLRLVDVMNRADIAAALDAQLQPVREDSPQLTEAFGKITELADALAREQELTAELREEIAAAAFVGSAATPMPAPRACQAGPCPARDYVGGLVAFAGVMGLAALLVIAAMHLAEALFG